MNLPAAPRLCLGARLTRLAACCIAAAVMWACGPVFIPVPPPDPGPPAFTIELVMDAGGVSRQVWIASGEPDPLAGNATYYLFDQDRNGGVIARAAADGSYRAPPMDGTEGDRVSIYYTDIRGNDSSLRCFLLSAKLPVADPCP